MDEFEVIQLNNYSPGAARGRIGSAVGPARGV